MPTANPRINVTLTPSLDALVLRMAKHQRTSKSQVLRELLEAAEPALHRAVSLMDAATKAAGELKSGLVRSLDAEQTRAEAELSRLLSSLDSATSDLVSKAEAIRPRRPARAPARAASGRVAAARVASDPPSSNRGVKSSRKGKTGRGRGSKNAV